MYATWEEVVLDDGLTQEVIASLRAISVECCLVSHLVDCLVHGLDDRGAEWAGDITDAKADDAFFRV